MQFRSDVDILRVTLMSGLYIDETIFCMILKLKFLSHTCKPETVTGHLEKYVTPGKGTQIVTAFQGGGVVE